MNLVMTPVYVRINLNALEGFCIETETSILKDCPICLEKCPKDSPGCKGGIEGHQMCPDCLEGMKYSGIDKCPTCRKLWKN